MENAYTKAKNAYTKGKNAYTKAKNAYTKAKNAYTKGGWAAGGRGRGRGHGRGSGGSVSRLGGCGKKKSRFFQFSTFLRFFNFLTKF